MKLQFSFSILLSFHLAPNVLQDSVVIGEIKENYILAIRSAFDNKTTKKYIKFFNKLGALNKKIRSFPWSEKPYIF